MTKLLRGGIGGLPTKATPRPDGCWACATTTAEGWKKMTSARSPGSRRLPIKEILTRSAASRGSVQKGIREDTSRLLIEKISRLQSNRDGRMCVARVLSLPRQVYDSRSDVDLFSLRRQTFLTGHVCVLNSMLLTISQSTGLTTSRVDALVCERQL